MTPRVNYAYIGPQFTFIGYSPISDRLAARGVLAAQVAVDFDRILVEFFGSNLTNKDYSSGQSGTVEYYGAPREYGVRTRISFLTRGTPFMHITPDDPTRDMPHPTGPDHAAALSRRQMLGAVAATGLAGAGAQAATVARPTSVALEFCYEAIVTLGPTEQVGASPIGKRIRIPITGGTFAGPNIGGTILPEGMDWQLLRSDGVLMVEAAYLMRENDGTLIHVVNKGLANRGYIRTTPTFEVPMGRHGWLNQWIFTGTIGLMPERGGRAVRITVYKLV